ncbi:MAG: hypothetical protein OEO23_15130, partial [Gemmatimonadota bacterium]|nr:hypothetical protein [Gemmatimonadota bacterium]
MRLHLYAAAGVAAWRCRRSIHRFGIAILALSAWGAVPGHAQEKRPIEPVDQFLLRAVGAPVVSPEGGWIAYTVGRTSHEEERSYSRIYMVSSEGGEPLALTAEGTSAGSPEWSPDGRYITFTASRAEGKNQVWALDRRGGEAFRLTDVPQGISAYRWSPDGTKLLLTIRDEEEDDPEEKENAPPDPWVIERLQFKRDNQGYLTGDRKTHLYVYELHTKELRQLTKGPWDESLGVWSPDGTRIAFVSNRTAEPDGNSNDDIWIVPADLEEPTESPQRVTAGVGSDGSPTWSPDGRWIAHTTDLRPDLIWYATTHLATTPATGGATTVLTENLDRNVSSPRVSADGDWIWFRLEDSGENHVARVRTDGSALERLVSGPLAAGGFDWSSGTFAVQISMLDRPGEIYVVDGLGDGSGTGAPEARPVRLTGHNDPFLDTVRIADTRNVQFESEDGIEIEG